jgi:hypothetical protein
MPAREVRCCDGVGDRQTGRSLLNLLTTIQHLEACKTDVFIEQQNLDTTTPMGKLFQITERSLSSNGI